MPGMGSLFGKILKTAKAETKAVGGKAARAKTQADEAYNARRRFKRQADRFMKEASKIGGASGGRYGVLANEFLKMAQGTYKDAKGAYDVSIIGKSRKALAGSGMSEDQETDIIMRSHVGSRIYAATIDIWKDEEYDNREDAIIKKFKAHDMSEVLKKLENELGSALYADDDQEKYDEVVTRIMAMIADAA